MKRIRNQNLWTAELVKDSLALSLKKINPKSLVKNPVIFISALGAVLSTLSLIKSFDSFSLQLTIWLWLTVLFANFSEALAEGRGRAQAMSLKISKKGLLAKLVTNQESKEEVDINAEDLCRGDIVICRAGDVIPRDGEVIEGVASVDESAITGESAPVIRESGGDRSAVTGGTTVKSDWILVKITANQGDNFIDKMINLIEGAKRQKTPNEIALTLVLSGLSLILLCVVFSLNFFADYSFVESGLKDKSFSIPIMTSFFVCLIPTTIGGLLSAIGISGMNRLVKNNVIAKSGRAVEAAGDISVLLLDKTGTITFGNRQAHEIISFSGVKQNELARVALLSSIADETPEGRSIVDLCRDILEEDTVDIKGNYLFVPFTAETRMSGVDITQDEDHPLKIRKGATDAIIGISEKISASAMKEIQNHVQKIAGEGGTPLLVSENGKILGVIYLKDIVKPGIREKFAELRKLGIKTVMITGDNPLTAGTIAAEAGVDDYIAEATPEMKLQKIRDEQESGNLVAMTGDGTNDAPALAQADVGVAMNSGTQAAREAGNMVDLDSDPTKLIDVVQVGKQMLITRGALTTFSFANDIAKYFAILPAIFSSLYLIEGNSPLQVFNVMNLHSAQSAILSAVIFNALIIILLTPLALRGVVYSGHSTDKLLLRNVTVYGVGGVIVPFIGIKLIDYLVTGLGLV